MFNEENKKIYTTITIYNYSEKLVLIACLHGLFLNSCTQFAINENAPIISVGVHLSVCLCSKKEFVMRGNEGQWTD